MQRRPVTALLTCILALAQSSFLLIPASLHAASDGTLGPSSTGSFDCSISIPPVLKISKIADIVRTWDGTGSQSGTDNVCVYTNDPAGTYQVTVTGSGAGGAFELSDGLGNVMNYRAFWNDVSGGTGRVEVFAGVVLSGQTGACTTSDTCSSCGNNTGQFRVQLSSSELLSVPSGTYTGTLSLMVEPD